MIRRLRLLIAKSEFTVFSTLLFVALYFWPFIAFAKPVRVFRFIFVVWSLQIALCLVRSIWGLEETETAQEGAEGGDSID